MQRSFGLDVLACPRCGGRFRLIALIEEAAVVRRSLRHLGLPPTCRLRVPVGRRLRRHGWKSSKTRSPLRDRVPRPATRPGDCRRPGEGPGTGVRAGGRGQPPLRLDRPNIAQNRSRIGLDRPGSGGDHPRCAWGRSTVPGGDQYRIPSTSPADPQGLHTSYRLAQAVPPGKGNSHASPTVTSRSFRNRLPLPTGTGLGPPERSRRSGRPGPAASGRGPGNRPQGCDSARHRPHSR
jgi:hypothetical protein